MANQSPAHLISRAAPKPSRVSGRGFAPPFWQLLCCYKGLWRRIGNPDPTLSTIKALQSTARNKIAHFSFLPVIDDRFVAPLSVRLFRFARVISSM
jgi:hypothetical protein